MESTGTISNGPRPSVSAAASQPKYKLSCVSCRARKIRCEKTHPCSHCVKAGTECVFPARKQMQRPRRANHKNSELLSRISRLESIVGKVDSTGLRSSIASRPDPSKKASVAASGSAQGQPRIHPFLQETQGAPAVQAEDRTSQRYLSGEFWANLCGEVEGLKQALFEQATDSDSDDDAESGTPESGAEYAPALRISTTIASCAWKDADYFNHPPPDKLQQLVTIYFENVGAILKILHRPTVLKLIESGTSNLNKSQEAILYSMYFAAVTSLTPAACRIRLGEDHATLCLRYQLALERALALADYLNNNDLECLQALTIYIACLRCHNGSRASWILVCLPMRLAQAFNIHRDGGGSKLTPYEAEMRRRTYWAIVILDVRAAEDRGTEAMMARYTYDTRLPLNINDDDFGPDSPGPLMELTGPTEMTFFLCCAQSSSIFLYMNDPTARLAGSTAPSEEDVIAHAQALETQFVANADPMHMGSYLASHLARIMSLKLWLMMQYPFHAPRKPATGSSATPPSQPQPRWPKVSGEAMLQTAVSILELTERMRSGPYNERYMWWNETYVQWHPLAVTLAELCAQTRGPLVERAWRSVDITLPRTSDIVADSRRGTLWRPIRKLVKKAKAARAAALEEDRRKEDAVVRQAETTAPAIASSSVEETHRLSADNRGEEGGLMVVDTSNNIHTGGDTTWFGASPTITFTDADLSSSSGFLAENVSLAWPEVDFDLPLDGGMDPMSNWAVWNEFVDDTYAEGSRTGSSGDDT